MYGITREITNTVTIGKPAEPSLCFSAECQRLGNQATITLTFGWLTNRYFWQESQGRAYDMCDTDADRTIAVLRTHGITIKNAEGR